MGEVPGTRPPADSLRDGEALPVDGRPPTPICPLSAGPPPPLEDREQGVLMGRGSPFLESPAEPSMALPSGGKGACNDREEVQTSPLTVTPSSGPC